MISNYAGDSLNLHLHHYCLTTFLWIFRTCGLLLLVEC